MITNTSLADQVKQARKSARLSHKELAVLASISRRPISLHESGKGDIRLETLSRILDALGLQLEIHPKPLNQGPSPSVNPNDEPDLRGPQLHNRHLVVRRRTIQLPPNLDNHPPLRIDFHGDPMPRHNPGVVPP